MIQDRAAADIPWIHSASLAPLNKFFNIKPVKKQARKPIRKSREELNSFKIRPVKNGISIVNPK